MKLAFLALLMLLPQPAPVDAGVSACPELFVAGVAPDLRRAGLATRTAELCYTDFAALHSGITAGPLWVAERITDDDVREAKRVPRVDQFFAEQQVPAADRAELEHYRGSGYDRGHMAPSADMTTERAQAESFSLANMVPQIPDLNRRLWADIESTARGLALTYGEVYIVTGPAFLGERVKRIGGRVIVPTATFKAVYVPSQRAAGVWWAPNSGDGRAFEVVSVDELERRVGIDVFPSLPGDITAAVARLPAPKAGSDSAAGGSVSSPQAHATRSQRTEPGWGQLVGDLAIDFIERLLK